MNPPDDVAIAGRAFGFLLDRYTAENIPDPEVADYVRRMIARRHPHAPADPPRALHGGDAAARGASSPRPVTPPRTPTPEHLNTEHLNADPPPPDRTPYSPASEAEAYILDCVSSNRQINRAHLAGLTGYHRRDIDALINGTISRKHGITAPVVDRRRGPLSEERKQKIAATKAANRAAREAPAKDQSDE